MELDLSIIIPAYNEEESLSSYLPTVIDFCKNNHWPLIVVNDGSKDKSASILDNYAKQNKILKVIHHKVNRGYGGAIKTGIENSVTNFVVTIDADGQHNLDDVLTLFNELKDKDADMIIGSRKGKVLSYYREVGKSLIRGVAKLLMPLHIHDINSGMKLYNAELAKKYLHLYPDSMAFSDIVALVFISQRHRVLEHPISINERIAGVSTIGIRTAIETLREMLNIVVLFNPMKIFLPFSLVCILVSIIWGVLSFMKNHDGVSVGSLLGFLTGILFFLLGLLAEQLSLLRKSNIKRK